MKVFILSHPCRKRCGSRKSGRWVACLSLWLMAATWSAPTAAISSTESVLDAGLSNLIYELLLGEMYGYQGDVPTAFEHYYRAALLTHDPKVAFRAVEIALWMKDLDRAKMAATRWQELIPEDSATHRVMGSIEAGLGNIEAAADAYQQSITLQPPRPDLHLIEIVNSLSSKVAARARRAVLQELARRYPDNAYAHYHYAEAAYQEQRGEEALVAIRRAVALQPQWSRAVYLQVQILRDQGDEAVAISLLQQTLTGPTQNPDRLRQSLADLLNQLGRHAEAREQYVRLLEHDRTNPQYQMAAGALSVLLQDWKEAKGHFLSLRANDRRLGGADEDLNHSVSSFFFGLIAEERGNLGRAIDMYYQVEELDYRGVDQYYQKARARIARLLLDGGQLKEARMHLAVSRAKSTRKENILQLYAAETDLLYGLRQYQAGLELMDDALDHYPGEVLLLYNRALIAERLGQTLGLERDLKAVLAKEPDHPQALNALGYTWVDHNRNLDQALEYIKRAHRQRPNDAAIIDSLGWAHYRLGNLVRAEELLQQAYALQPDGEIIAHLVEVMWMSGQRQEARQIYQEALERLPNNEFLQRLAKQLSL